jgi:hypothetical protein
MKFDDASWHYGGDFPAGLPAEAGATHIGMFMAWLICGSLISDELLGDAATAVASVRAGTMTGPTFVMTVLNGKLTDNDLSPTGAAFTMAYYEGAGGEVTYLTDYSDMFASEPGIDSLYAVPDSQENYEQMAPIITFRFDHWLAAGQPPFIS